MDGNQKNQPSTTWILLDHPIGVQWRSISSVGQSIRHQLDDPGTWESAEKDPVFDGATTAIEAEDATAKWN